jgi:5-methylcytosine-specific restriction protein A
MNLLHGLEMCINGLGGGIFNMPYAPGRPCRNRSCSSTTTNRNGYCDSCQSMVYLRPGKRGTSNERGYDRRWVLVRELYIREHPLCEDCLLLGLVVVTQMVHHIVAIADGGAQYEDDNLRSLCWICHGKYAEHHEFIL